MPEPVTSSEADRIIKETVQTVQPVKRPLETASGYVLREAIKCDRPAPPFDRVMMDGYAINVETWNSGTRNYKHFATQAAGDKEITGCPIDSCVEVMTGSVLPHNCDCIIPYEWTSRKDDTITINADIKAEHFLYVHKKGSDFSEGSVVIEPGCRLGATHIGTAASFGYDEIKVSPLPSIAIAGTGNELIPIKQKPLPQQIRQSNSYSIEASLNLAGFSSDKRLHLPDDKETIQSSLRDLVENHDFIIISGGISKGKFDYIPSTLDSLDTQCLFHGVKQRPGKPLGFWAGDGKYIITLPGNPVSTVTGLHQYVLPALRKYCGENEAEKRMVRLSENFEFKAELTCFLPVKLNADGVATPAPVQNSGDFGHLLNSDGYIELPEDETLFKADSAYPFTHWY